MLIVEGLMDTVRRVWIISEPCQHSPKRRARMEGTVRVMINLDCRLDWLKKYPRYSSMEDTFECLCGSVSRGRTNPECERHSHRPNKMVKRRKTC